MNYYHIAVIPGDGIGQEITPPGVSVLQQAAEASGAFKLDTEIFPWGSQYYLAHGLMMPKDGLHILESFDAIYFGAVGWPEVPDHITLHGLRLVICQSFDQYANIRPAMLLPGIDGPLHGKGPEDFNVVVVRENTEGEYAGAGGHVHRHMPLEVATETAIFTRAGIERVMRYAFQIAQKRPRKQLTCVTKSNAQQYGFVLWDEVFDGLAAQFPDVKVDRMLVDAMAARFVLKPETIDVVVASNLHADILTDLSGAICGSLGLAPSSNLNPERNYPSMFEPIHGSAPDIHGKGIANPLGMIWSGALMLEFLGENDAADLIVSAIKSTTASREALTRDVGGNATTLEATNAVISHLRSGHI